MDWPSTNLLKSFMDQEVQPFYLVSTLKHDTSIEDVSGVNHVKNMRKWIGIGSAMRKVPLIKNHMPFTTYIRMHLNSICTYVQG